MGPRTSIRTFASIFSYLRGWTTPSLSPLATAQPRYRIDSCRPFQIPIPYWDRDFVPLDPVRSDQFHNLACPGRAFSLFFGRAGRNEWSLFENKTIRLQLRVSLSLFASPKVVTSLFASISSTEPEGDFDHSTLASEGRMSLGIPESDSSLSDPGLGRTCLWLVFRLKRC